MIVTRRPPERRRGGSSSPTERHPRLDNLNHYGKDFRRNQNTGKKQWIGKKFPRNCDSPGNQRRIKMLKKKEKRYAFLVRTGSMLSRMSGAASNSLPIRGIFTSGCAPKINISL